MKRVLITLFIVALCVSAFAHTGLFGLSYLDSYATCTQKLSKEGFKPIAKDSNTFKNGTTPSTDVTLYFSEENKQLVSWLIVIPPEMYGGYDLVEEHFINILEVLHGSDFDYDWDYLEAYWRLDEEHYLTAAFDAFMEDYWIFYGNDKYPGFSPY